MLSETIFFPVLQEFKRLKLGTTVSKLGVYHEKRRKFVFKVKRPGIGTSISFGNILHSYPYKFPNFSTLYPYFIENRTEIPWLCMTSISLSALLLLLPIYYLFCFFSMSFFYLTRKSNKDVRFNCLKLVTARLQFPTSACAGVYFPLRYGNNTELVQDHKANTCIIGFWYNNSLWQWILYVKYNSRENRNILVLLVICD